MQSFPKTKQDIDKLKTPLRLDWKCCFNAREIRSTIFRRRGTLNVVYKSQRHNNGTHAL